MFASLRVTSNATEGVADAVWFRFRYVRKMASSLANSNIAECCISQISLSIKNGEGIWCSRVGIYVYSSFHTIDPRCYQCGHRWLKENTMEAYG